jgi:2-polyprenyl-6-methoxyphenol hydroxylase-like FAD-dependent oxidoreductase
MIEVIEGTVTSLLEDASKTVQGVHYKINSKGAIKHLEARADLTLVADGIWSSLRRASTFSHSTTMFYASVQNSDVGRKTLAFVVFCRCYCRTSAWRTSCTIPWLRSRYSCSSVTLSHISDLQHAYPCACGHSGNHSFTGRWCSDRVHEDSCRTANARSVPRKLPALNRQTGGTGNNIFAHLL